MLAVTALLSHVPTYDECVDNCCEMRRPDISQVLYLNGSGGLQVRLADLEDVVQFTMASFFVLRSLIVNQHLTHEAVHA